MLAQTRHKSLPLLGRTWARPCTPPPKPCTTCWPRPRGPSTRCGPSGWSGAPGLGHDATTPGILGLDETDDRQKGPTTDDVASPSIGNRPPLANGVVSVKASGLLETTPLPLLVRVFKPEARLKPGEVSQSTPHLASAIMEELVALGFRFSVVLAE